MPFSHHSHSGQFCPGHARNSLEEMIETAIEKQMEVFCLSEHMPRYDEDLYPEEIEMGLTYEKLEAIHRTFFKEAKMLRERYKSQIRIVLGFESEWIRQSSLHLINRSLQSNPWDYFVGSVHHLHTRPIDVDRANYEAARDLSGGSEERLFGDYFDAQLAMLQATKPPIVGHFDLIRLKSDNPERSFQGWPNVWERILRNLNFVVSYGGLLEINFSSLRKGMSEPYPKDEIAKRFVLMGGKFCLSDDSHGVEQVGLNYQQCIPYLRRNEITCVHFLECVDEHDSPPFDSRFPGTKLRSLTLAELGGLPFWRKGE